MNGILDALFALGCVSTVLVDEHFEQEPMGGAYIGSRSNRAVGEKAVSDSNNAGQTGAAPDPIVGLNCECISSVSKLAVRDQPMIHLNCVGSTDEHSCSESRKKCSLCNLTDDTFHHHRFNR